MILVVTSRIRRGVSPPNSLSLMHCFASGMAMSMFAIGFGIGELGRWVWPKSRPRFINRANIKIPIRIGEAYDGRIRTAMNLDSARWLLSKLSQYIVTIQMFLAGAFECDL